MAKTKNIKKSAEEIQDEIFRRMSAERKMQYAFDFFEFGKKLMALDGRRLYGTYGRKNLPRSR